MSTDKKILVVDSDTFLSQILSVRFRHSGFNSLAADTMEEAWGQLQDFRPEVILSGTQLGNDSGLDLLDRVRQWEQESGHKTRFILLDRISNEKFLKASQLKGADGYIAKTAASFDDILAVVKGDS